MLIIFTSVVNRIINTSSNERIIVQVYDTCPQMFDVCSGVPRNFVRGGGGSTNSVEDRGHSEGGSEGGSPLVRGSDQFANE
jgi:hypothetical protein